MHAGESDQLPLDCFRLRVQTLHSSEPKPQGGRKRPVHRPSYAEAHSDGTLPMTSRARCSEHPWSGGCGERVSPASLAVSPACNMARLFSICSGEAMHPLA
jgi:hypothetical protein